MDSIPVASPPHTAGQEKKKCGVEAPLPAEESKAMLIAAFAPASLSPEGTTNREKNGSGAAAEVTEHGQGPVSSTEEQGSPQISSASTQDSGDQAEGDVTTASKKEADRDPPEQTQKHKSAEKESVHQEREQGSQDLKNFLAKTPEKAGHTDENKPLDEKMTQMQLKSPHDKSLPRVPATFLSPQKSPSRDSVDLTSPSAMKGAVAAAKTLTKGGKSPSPQARKNPFPDKV